MNSRKLAQEVVGILAGVIVHQRPRWAPLLGHRRQIEAWWKAEFATAIESWTWTRELKRSFDLIVEPKPRDFGHGDSGLAADLVVAPYDAHQDRASTTAFPRVWVEVKERGTWWGDVGKAIGTANHGLLWDLQKWQGVQWTSNEVVLACHLLTHDGDLTTTIPTNWEDALDQVATDHPRYCPVQTIGYPIGEKQVRWVRMDVFTIHGAP